MADTSDITQKIKSLIRKADTSRGVTQEEADAFMAKAQELMVRHGIDRISVMENEEDEKIRFEIVEGEYKTNRPRFITDQYISRILCECFEVRVIWDVDYVLVPGRKGSIIKQWATHLIYCIVGDKPDVELAKIVAQELHPMMKHLYKQYLRQTGGVSCAASYHPFLMGLVKAYIEKNRKTKEELLLNETSDISEKYALAVQDKDAAREEFITCNIQTVRSKQRGPQNHRWDEDAYQNGREQGDGLKLGVAKLE